MRRKMIEVPEDLPHVIRSKIELVGLQFLTGVKVFVVPNKVTEDGLSWLMNVEFVLNQDDESGIVVELGECLHMSSVPDDYYIPANIVMDEDYLLYVLTAIIKKEIREFKIEYKENFKKVDIELRIHNTWFSAVSDFTKLESAFKIVKTEE